MFILFKASNDLTQVDKKKTEYKSSRTKEICNKSEKDGEKLVGETGQWESGEGKNELISEPKQKLVERDRVCV